jgi:hypothetical protein
MELYKIHENKSKHSAFSINKKRFKFQNGMIAVDDKEAIEYLDNCGYADKISNEKPKEIKEKK